MKKIIFTISTIALVGLNAMSYTVNAEGANDKVLKHDFHHVKNVHVFEKENGITEYDFMKNGQYVSAFYTNTGELIEADYAVDFNALPQRAKQVIHTQYSNSNIVNIIKVEQQDNTFYKVSLEAGGLSYSMAITPEGQITIGF